jgi:hypothetical protein
VLIDASASAARSWIPAHRHGSPDEICADTLNRHRILQ